MRSGPEIKTGDPSLGLGELRDLAGGPLAEVRADASLRVDVECRTEFWVQDRHAAVMTFGSWN